MGSRAPVGVHSTPLLFTPTTHVSAHALSSPRGIGILAPAPRSCPRCDQRAGGARVGPPSPTHTLATHRVRTRHGTLAGSSRSSSLCTSSQQPPRLRAGGWATNGRLLCPRHRNFGLRKIGTAGSRAPTSDHPRGGRRQRPPPGQPPPLRRDGPIQTRQLRRDATALPHRTSHATMHAWECPGDRPAPIFPRHAREGEPGGLTPLDSRSPLGPQQPRPQLGPQLVSRARLSASDGACPISPTPPPSD